MPINREEPVIRLYTITAGISESLLSGIIKIGFPHYQWVDNPAAADYFVFPANYEVGHELTDQYLNYFKGLPKDRELTLQYEKKLTALAGQFKKKIIIFYYSDLHDPVQVDHAIVFRTSILKSLQRKNELAMPAFKNDLSESSGSFPEFISWQSVPSIGFRGQSAPLLLKPKLRMYNQVNLLLNQWGRENVFSLKENHGYLQRRNALRFLQKDSNIHCDFALTTEKDIEDPASKQLFRDNIFSNPYTLCVSGYGNYSFRLYETLSAGRIPVFINTDCQLPFEETVHWKELVVWVEEREIPLIGRKIMAFHQRKRGEAFIRHQQMLKEFWKKYLSPGGYFSNIRSYLTQDDRP